MSVQKLSSSTTPAHQANTAEARATWRREQKHLGRVS